MIAAALLSILLGAPRRTRIHTPSKAQRVELAKLQKVRDSLLASHWDSRRQNLAERDAWQETFNQVRDSLEAIRQERSQLDLELRRILRDQAAASSPSVLPPNPGDPLDGIRRNLAGRLEALRERVDKGVPWKKAERLASVDSVRAAVAQVSSVETALPRAVQAWRSEWVRSRTLDSSTGLLPGPKAILAKAASGSSDRWGDGMSLPTAPSAARFCVRTWCHMGVARRSLRLRLGGSGEPRRLRSAAAGSRHRTAGRLGVFPHGNAFPSWTDRLSRFVDLRQGPLHLVGLWVARAVMALLVFLGAVVLWAGWAGHKRFRREESDRTDYEARIMPAMSDAAEAERFSATLPDTIAGRQTRLGLRSRNLSPEALEQLLTASESSDQRRLEKGLAQLGTIGSNAPFIGLFGTVCGILDAFAALGREGAGPQAVMSAIAQALIATAVGLAVAIPAIWIYNTLQSRVLELGARARELRTLMVAASLEAAARGADRKS